MLPRESKKRPDDHDRHHQRRDPGSRRLRAFRTEPRRGSGKRASDDLRDQRTEERDSRVSPGDFYKSCIPRLYDTGYARRRTWRLTQECNRTCGRNRRRTWIWRQHQGGSDHTRDCGDRTPWNEDGRQSGDFWRAFRDRRSDRNLRECPQP